MKATNYKMMTIRAKNYFYYWLFVARA